MIMINKILTVIGVICLFSCGRPEVYSDVVEYPDAQMMWDKSTNFEFTLDKDQSLVSFLHIQHNNMYPYQNIYFFTQVEYPDGNVQADTLQYMLAKPNGEWLGKGMGASKEMYLQYPLNLSQKGDYKVSIWQAMREDKLVGIEKLAFSIQELTN